ncbi:MAG: DNA-directed RNA polymerase subunit beta' [Candidatus Taylorbacteria bacterium RIFCSPHIGHO2_02_FULL_47_18]|nr:MAG: DNA-directed RNA polymerase subunit beta' [Candidatus Taylorbacteria bacterium RIFCSPHIGHO2_02_FULL_47_18]OHA40429.1 MAG: DNA-directed RNA polymerase subunit beta' [Candidatus Taylorbacteria bacterium RIFCSPLOWO2_02_FULL_48_16]
MFRPNPTSIPLDFDSVRIGLASPERIKEWSQGEVTKPETINYRTQRSERSGLFDEKIFGPEKDYECYCGKYRGIRFKGIVCEKCGVELTRAVVRRERMGHIDLASPVSHIWFLRGLPSRLSLFLGMTSLDVERVIYFAGYLVTRVNEVEQGQLLKELDTEYKTKVKAAGDEKTKEALKERFLGAKREIDGIVPGLVLDEVSFHGYSMRYGACFEAEIGAEAIYNLCKQVDLETLRGELEAAQEKAGAGERERLSKRLALIRGMIASGMRPEWMFLSRIPVIPPGLRPMVPLDGGRYATSDVNDLYRRVINRNNRLKKLLEINAPEVILRNEKRILQEAVDSLIDNSIRHGSSSSGGGPAARRQLKSLADNLKGKRGLFRQNLLGKRVDYSGRSVIVVGPELKLNQCGLPKHMALELFRPFVLSELIKRELAFNIRGAGRLIEDQIPEVWAILEEVTRGKYVLLNRAPTLHRLGIQAFQPVLIEGSAIQVHPLVCSAFNADFDGDQMAVHVPLSEEAQLEAREFMAADKNILKPGNGEPTVSAKMLDIVLGVYWKTKIVEGARGEGSYFASPLDALTALQFETIDCRARIKVGVPKDTKYTAFAGDYFETTAGRVLFNGVLPADYPFLNSEIDRKKMAGLVDDLMRRYGLERIPEIMDAIKNFGFKYATQSGITWGIDDVIEPKDKELVIAKAKRKSDEVFAQWSEGLLSEGERIRKNIEIWQATKNDVEKLVPGTLQKDGSVYDMVHSGARGSLSQITQMVGMKGLIQNTAGETIEMPITSCMKRGLTPTEYFVTTHGSRKGQTDTALNTAKAGYMTRKLFVVAQDMVITEDDCNTKEFVVIKKGGASGMDISFVKSARGRVLAADVSGASGEKLFSKGHLLTKVDAQALDTAQIKEIAVRSPLRCGLRHGVCAHCYGEDLGKGGLVQLGEAIGTIAAQAIGEPGTQLTMRTFHAGGTASVGGDITQGLPRVEEVFEKRHPKNPAVIAAEDGTVIEIKEDGKEKIIVLMPDVPAKSKKGPVLQGGEAIEYATSFSRTPLIKVGSVVKRGDLLTDGSADIGELYKLAGRDRVQEYLIAEISKPYELQGETVSRKHIEVIIRQMFSRLTVKEPHDTAFSVGDVVDQREFDAENEEAEKRGELPAKAEAAVMGISEVSLSRRNFLAAASFQHTTRVLIGAASRGSVDRLQGLMENVIIGRLIPAGTGFPASPKYARIAEMQKERAARIASEQAVYAAEEKDI